MHAPRPIAPITALNRRIPDSQWIDLGVILLAGNLASALSWRFGIPINSGPFSIALAVVLYLYVGPAPWIALHRQRAFAPVRLRRLGLAVVGGLVLAGPSVLFFYVTSRTGGLGYSPIRSLSSAALLVRLFVEIPLLTAFVEEVVFRQSLYVKFAAATPARTIARNAGIFTLWHLVVTLRTVGDTSLGRQPLLLFGAYLGSLATIFVGGMVFALVRQRTGSFACSAITHWLTVALLTLGAWVFG